MIWLLHVAGRLGAEVRPERWDHTTKATNEESSLTDELKTGNAILRELAPSQWEYSG
jgi:hypothetical protein